MKIYKIVVVVLLIALAASLVLYVATRVVQYIQKGPNTTTPLIRKADPLPGIHGTPIRIGGILPLSGSIAIYGLDCLNGVELAFEEINATGGVNGRPLELIVEDDEGTPEITANAYSKLVTRDGVNVMIGSITSNCTIVAASLAQAQQVVLLTPAATAVPVTEVGDFIFRACFIDPLQGTAAGRFATEELGIRRAAVLYDISNDYSVGLYETFKNAVEAAGGAVTSESYSTGNIDFYAQITKIRRDNPDIVYIPDYYNIASLIAGQLRNSGINTPIIGSDGWDGVTDIAGNEMLNAFYSNHYAVNSTDPKATAFARNYESRYGIKPKAFGALGYDCAYILRDALLKVDDLSDSAAIRDALSKTNGSYVTGYISFDKNRNPIKSVFMLEIIKGGNGNLTTVYRSRIDPKR